MVSAEIPSDTLALFFWAIKSDLTDSALALVLVITTSSKTFFCEAILTFKLTVSFAITVTSETTLD